MTGTTGYADLVCGERHPLPLATAAASGYHRALLDGGARESPLAGKRQTREHVIADLGVIHVERQALLAGYTVDRFVHDYGLDLILVTYDAVGEVEPGPIFL